MPMFPSPLAAAVLATVKVAGYAGFARALNRKTGQNVAPIKFGAAKTGLGLLGGVVYLFWLLPVFGAEDMSSAAVFLGAMPVRLLMWSVALRLFYEFQGRRGLIFGGVVLGTIWSYALDGVMWLIYKIVPGMTMPVC
jgi:hypothetical protein